MRITHTHTRLVLYYSVCLCALYMHELCARYSRPRIKLVFGERLNKYYIYEAVAVAVVLYQTVGIRVENIQWNDSRRGWMDKVQRYDLVRRVPFRPTAAALAFPFCMRVEYVLKCARTVSL